MIIIKVIRTGGRGAPLNTHEFRDEKKALRFLKNLAREHEDKNVTEPNGSGMTWRPGAVAKRIKLRRYTGTDTIKVEITHEDDSLY